MIYHYWFVLRRCVCSATAGNFIVLTPYYSLLAIKQEKNKINITLFLS